MAAAAIFKSDPCAHFRLNRCILNRSCRSRNIPTKFGENWSNSKVMAYIFRNSRWWRLNLGECAFSTWQLCSIMNLQDSHQLWWTSVQQWRNSDSFSKFKMVVAAILNFSKCAFLDKTVHSISYSQHSHQIWCAVDWQHNFCIQNGGSHHLEFYWMRIFTIVVAF